MTISLIIIACLYGLGLAFGTLVGTATALHKDSLREELGYGFQQLPYDELAFKKTVILLKVWGICLVWPIALAYLAFKPIIQHILGTTRHTIKLTEPHRKALTTRVKTAFTPKPEPPEHLIGQVSMASPDFKGALSLDKEP